jgi:hypothetical protein
MVQLLGFPGSRSLNRCAKCSGEMDVGALYQLLQFRDGVGHLRSGGKSSHKGKVFVLREIGLE